MLCPRSCGLLAIAYTITALSTARADKGATQSEALLEPKSLSDTNESAGETIIVTGARREQTLKAATTATEVIGSQEIEDSGAETLAGVLSTHPGLDVQPSFRGSQVRMQGMASTYVLVLVDGERAIGRIGGAIDLQRFPVEDIERIEIVKGPSSALYGSDALAGVINIITKKSSELLSARLHSSMGQWGKTDLSGDLGASLGAWTSNASFGWHVGDGYDLDPSDLATTASSFDERHLKQTLAVAIRKSLTLRANGEYLLRDQAGIDVSGSGAVYDRTSRTETAGASIGFDWFSAAGARLAATLRYGLWHDQLLRDQRRSDALDSFEKTEEQIGELRVQHDRALTPQHFLSVGLEGLVQGLTADRLSSSGSRFRSALFVQDEWTLSTAPYIVVSPGIRADVDTQFGTHITPKLAARWDVREEVTVRASYGQGYRAPSFRELLLFFENPAVGYRVLGNEALAPETSHGANASTQAKLGKRTWGTLSVFYNDVENLITTDLVTDSDMDGSQVFGYVNISSARTGGLESRLTASPIEGWTVDVGYTFTDTLDRSSNRPLPGRARHQASAKTTYQPAGSVIRMSMRGSLYGSRVFFQNDDEVSSSPYADLSGRIAGELAPFLSVFAGVENVLGAGDATLLPIAPRSFYGGMTARY